ncbi:MAG: NYN domain-containing protein [Candidatus Staskawiczbacteria bacterium]|nr:NYN domain-containing protein [Candidatus Staskawiczbacteria bacterium]
MQPFSYPLLEIRRNRILCLLDVDNIAINTNPDSSDLPRALDAITRYLSRIGRVVKACAFGPELTLASASDALRLRSFILIQCPKVLVDKQFGAQTEKKDTADLEFIRVGTIDINEMSGLTHLALCSGDSQFEQFVRWAESQGLKIIIVAGNRKSLSPKIAELASRGSDGQKMVYVLPP